MSDFDGAGTANIVVVGSANIDLVASASHIPAAGETVLGDEFRMVHGGKGANQALAVARLGESAAFVGRVGDDDFGRSLRDGLEDAGVDCRFLDTTRGQPSGVALIVVSRGGENAICVAAGANACLTPQDIDRAEPVIAAARVCLVQLEIPIATVLRAIEIARHHGVTTVLDPAPAPANAPAALFAVDILTPNETEARQLLGDAAAADALTAGRRLLERGARDVVLKRGARETVWVHAGGAESYAVADVKVVDSTGAGDAFSAGLAVGRARGMDMPQSVRFASAAGSLACTRFGAQPSMPRLEEVEALLAK